MKVIQRLLDCYVLVPEVHFDKRGFFFESWSDDSFKRLGLNYNFLQDNQSLSLRAGTLRGIHFQIGRFSQTKLVRCTRNRALSFAIDLRGRSPTYKQWVAVEISDANKVQFLIPRGFGHAVLTLDDKVEIQYKVDNPYLENKQGLILWSDPEIGVNWSVKDPILSDRDAKAPLLKDIYTGFEDWS